jgi:hypothetical protein
LKFRWMNGWTHCKVALLYVIIPSTAVAAILFYLSGNPPCGADSDGNNVCHPPLKTNSTAAEVFVSASASWWVLFIFVRQVITLTLALATMHFVVDYLAIRTKLFAWTLGPLVTLFIVLSRGWCLTLFFWACVRMVLPTNTVALYPLVFLLTDWFNLLFSMTLLFSTGVIPLLTNGKCNCWCFAGRSTILSHFC